MMCQHGTQLAIQYFFVWTASQDTYDDDDGDDDDDDDDDDVVDVDDDDDDDDDDVDDHTSNPSWQAVEIFASHPSL